MNLIPYTQLWKEEPELLVNRAKAVPEGGMIVEIGTAEGGTARLLYDAANSNNVEIYTIDVALTKKASQILKNTNVKIVTEESSSCAREWGNEIKSQIDFLLIDGDHSFLGVYNDFYSWIPNLASNAVIAFHDYDSPERGGIAHFGVKVFIDTLVENNILKDISHEYRFLFCRLNVDRSSSLSIESFFNTFNNIGKEINKVREKIFKESLGCGIELIKNNKAEVDSLQACYCVEGLVKNHDGLLLEISNNKCETIYWIEMYQMLEHAYVQSFFPDHIECIPVPSDETEMSNLIAKEYIKVQILKNILKTVVLWTP